VLWTNDQMSLQILYFVFILLYFFPYYYFFQAGGGVRVVWTNIHLLVEIHSKKNLKKSGGRGIKFKKKIKKNQAGGE
jgi:hypothetical protein